MISQEKTGIMHFSSVTQFILERAPQQLSKGRAVITPWKIENWFKDFANFMSIEVTDTNLWKDPSCWLMLMSLDFPCFQKVVKC